MAWFYLTIQQRRQAMKIERLIKKMSKQEKQQLVLYPERLSY